MLLFLYNCGARVSEVTGLPWSDLQLMPPRQVRLTGKGRKERLVPIWSQTADALRRLHGMTAEDQRHVFVNRHGQPLTRDGVAYILTKHVSAAAQDRPTLARDRVTPHVLRHSCAAALLQSGTDVTVIRDYLGHASIATTSRYIATNLKMKRDALQTLETCRSRARRDQTMEAEARPAFFPPVALILCRQTPPAFSPEPSF
ncbi:tyrosine-type recombinase/integrase [Mesorhizobium sp. M0167]|uniref:tyrosine-type recombinase/integrase n=1 Tax=unclassified Mesorhizobium TaxID=325217 RepID=UPI003337EC97